MSGWVSVGEKKPRKKPLAKRKPVAKPSNLNNFETAIFDYLVSQYPTARSCEDILEALVRRENNSKNGGFDGFGGDNVSIEMIWDAIDKQGGLELVTELKPGTKYVVMTQ
jgi:hypothetical protein